MIIIRINMIIILKTKAINLLFSIINNITPTHRVTHTYRNEVKSTIKKNGWLEDKLENNG